MRDGTFPNPDAQNKKALKTLIKSLFCAFLLTCGFGLTAEVVWAGVNPHKVITPGVALPRGSCSGYELGYSSAAVQNVEIAISSVGIDDGDLFLMTHNGSGKLTIVSGGKYLVNYGLTMECATANKHVNTGLYTGGAGQLSGRQHVEFGAANAEEQVSGSGILDLAAGATLEIYFKCLDAGSPTITIDHTNLTAVMVGGR